MAVEVTLLPLHLDVIKPSGGQLPPEDALLEMTKRVHERDTKTCRYCGMYSPNGSALEIDHLDGDHTNWEIDNLVSACLWCHGCHHLEFSLAAGAQLVQWDYPQAACSRMAQQIIVSGNLFELYNQMVEAGVERREHNYPGGIINMLVSSLSSKIASGENVEARKILRSMEDDSIRLVYPTNQYLGAVQSIPGVSPAAWKHFRRYYINYVNENINDANLTAKLLKAWMELA